MVTIAKFSLKVYVYPHNSWLIWTFHLKKKKWRKKQTEKSPAADWAQITVMGHGKLWETYGVTWLKSVLLAHWCDKTVQEVALHLQVDQFASTATPGEIHLSYDTYKLKTSMLWKRGNFTLVILGQCKWAQVLLKQ